jgi:hypothetical protein
MSAKSRAKIAVAQRARWAKVRKKRVRVGSDPPLHKTSTSLVRTKDMAFVLNRPPDAETGQVVVIAQFAERLSLAYTCTIPYEFCCGMRGVADCGHDNRDKPAAPPPRRLQGSKTGRPHRNQASPSGKGGTRSQPNKFEKLAVRRTLRMVRWVGTIPAAGVCTFCDRLFMVPMESLKKVADAQWSLNLQFDEHKCQRGRQSSQPCANQRPGVRFVRAS